VCPFAKYIIHLYARSEKVILIVTIKANKEEKQKITKKLITANK